MYTSVNHNNVAKVVGRVDEMPIFSHCHCEEDFYIFKLKVRRLSDSNDYINVTVSEKFMKIVDIVPDTVLEIEGQFRSYNNYSDNGSKLQLTLFARDIREWVDENDIENPNEIMLNGYICKEPVYRTTPFGREIADILVAVNRSYGKSDYIPCITWGRNAKYSSKLKVGDNIKLWGRIQSREYQKKLEDGEIITKTAYEISVSKLELAQSSTLD